MHDVTCSFTSGNEVGGLKLDHDLMQALGATSPAEASNMARDFFRQMLPFFVAIRTGQSLPIADAFVVQHTTQTN